MPHGLPLRRVGFGSEFHVCPALKGHSEGFSAKATSCRSVPRGARLGWPHLRASWLESRDAPARRPHLGGLASFCARLFEDRRSVGRRPRLRFLQPMAALGIQLFSMPQVPLERSGGSCVLEGLLRGGTSSVRLARRLRNRATVRLAEPWAGPTRSDRAGLLSPRVFREPRSAVRPVRLLWTQPMAALGIQLFSMPQARWSNPAGLCFRPMVSPRRSSLFAEFAVRLPARSGSGACSQWLCWGSNSSRCRKSRWSDPAGLVFYGPDGRC